MRFISSGCLAAIICFFLTSQSFAVEIATNPVHRLLPNTTSKYLAPCSDFVEEQVEMDTAVTCGNNNGFEKKAENVEIPKCFVIKDEAPDLIKDSDGIHFSLPIGNFQTMSAVGFYDGEAIYLVENPELDHIYRHELGHYLLRIVEGDPDGDHDRPFWSYCSTQYFDPDNLEPPKAASFYNLILFAF